MKISKKLFSLAIGALMAIGVGAGVKQTAERLSADSATYTFSSKSWGDNTSSWTSTKDGNSLATNQGVQVTKGVTGAGCKSKNPFSNISNIVVKYCTNTSSGKGSIKVQIGDGITQSYAVSAPSSNGTNLRDTDAFTFDPTETGAVKLTVDCTTNSIYIYSITINYGTSTGEGSSSGSSNSSSSAAPILVESVDIAKDSLTLNVGEKDTLYATVEPSNATNKGLDWSSSNESVATVDDSGKVTAVGAGTCNIIATAKDGSGESDSCSLTVTNWQNLVWNFNDYCDANGIASGAGNESQIGAEPYVYEGISLTGTTASGKTNTRFYNSGGTQDLRIYVGGTITFSANTKKIYKIVFGAGSLSSDIGEMNSNTWTYLDGTNGVTFTSSATSTIKEITIYYTEIIPDKYTVTFDANGGSFNEGKGISLEFDTGTKHDVTLPLVSDLATTADKYTVFTGWKANSNTYEAGDTVEVTTFTTFVAQYAVPESITIAQALELANTYGETGTTYAFKATGCVTAVETFEGKSYVNITISDGSNSILVNTYSDASKLVAEKNQYINVEGKLKIYSSKPEFASATITIVTKTSVVTFDVNGGNGTFEKQIIVGETGKAEEPKTKPTKDDYDFGGWYYNDVEWDFNNVVESDMVLVAKWNEKVMDLVTSSQLNIKYRYNNFERASNLVSGKSYVFSNGTGAYLTNNLTSGKFAVTDDISQAAEIIIVSEDNGYFLKLGQQYIKYTSSTDLALDNNGYKWTVSVDGTDEEKTFKFLSATTSTRSLSYQVSGNVFGGYSTTNSTGYVFNLVLFTKTDLSINSITQYGLRFSCEFNEPTIKSKFATPANWQCGFMVAQTAQMNTTFEESYECLNLKDVLKSSDDPIADVAAGAMKTDTNAKISKYAKTMDKLPEAVAGMYEFSVNVTIPEANLEDSVSAVWFAYNTVTHEFVFASQKDMSIKDICGIYDKMELELNDHQNAAIDYIIAQNKWVYPED